MKVLLLHEMSGVHTELKKGLREIGVEAHIATHGDSFKKFKSDINLGSISGTLASHFDRAKNQLLICKKLDQYDVVQSISPNPFYSPISRLLDAMFFNTDCRKVYIAAGSDPIYRKHVQTLNYYPPHDWFNNQKKYSLFSKRVQNYDNIVPVCWEYKYCMEEAGLQPKPIIPFPIDLKKFRPERKNNRKKIVFFHPLNRTNLKYDFKGTLIIQEAFRILEDRYSDVADFICKGNMSYREYDEFTSHVDVIVDQVYSYSYGMSAALALAKGKIVMSGLEERVKSIDTHYTQCPVVNITPNVLDIVQKIEDIIMNMHNINQIQIESREFAEKYHCSKKVAEQFLNKIY